MANQTVKYSIASFRSRFVYLLSPVLESLINTGFHQCWKQTTLFVFMAERKDDQKTSTPEQHSAFHLSKKTRQFQSHHYCLKITIKAAFLNCILHKKLLVLQSSQHCSHFLHFYLVVFRKNFWDMWKVVIVRSSTSQILTYK